MKTTNGKSTNGKLSNGKQSNGNSNAPRKNGEDHATKLQKLLEDELKDIYWAEKALTKAIPKMIKKASDKRLVDALQNHLSETEEHVRRCEQAFELLGKEAKAKKCEAMAGLMKEAEEIMEDSEAGVMRDAGIILAAQKVEHYEIATYGTLRTFAHTLGLDKVASILEKTLEEEKNADVTLTEVAETCINVDAATEEVEA